ncbi:MAG: ATP-binding cassette domain-containing protein [Planctomycetes bacterium]|nr:ATP-binding cassette domain-containing protein [Planctomycetota bacterium]
MSDVVAVEGLRHQYGERVALDGISFSVAPGEIFGLLGPNGGGKTTLFRILTTLLPPTGGRATICGHDVVRERSQVRSKLGVVFQSPSLDIHLRARENLRHGGNLYGLKGRDLENRIENSLGRLRVADRADDLVKTLSGGLRRRVEIAKCMLHRPALLILDEPSTGLDPGARFDLWRNLQELVEAEGTTILITTHFMDEAERCGRVGILDRGKLVACGSPSELKSRLGGDCITIVTEDAVSLRDLIEAKLNCITMVVGQTLRIETPDAGRMMSLVLESFQDRIRSMTIGKPTLEDVFMHHTGHRFDGGLEG